MPGSLGRRIVDWLDKRVALCRIADRILRDPVPERGGWWYTLGASIFVLLIVQVVTGVFLMMDYVPSWNEARDSILHIQNEVFLGWLVRGIHYWNMVALVLLVGVHLLRTYLSAAYKSPRELNWVLGVILLVLMVGTSFTGGILRWDQSGYFDVVVGTTIAGWTPIVGPWVAQLWRGGEAITPLALTRTYALHVWILPVPLLLIATVHIGLVILLGQFGSWVNYEPEPPGAPPPDEDEIASRRKLEHEILDPQERKVNLPTRTTWFYPYHMFKEGVVSLLLFVGVLLAAFLFPAPIEEPVDPTTITFAPTSMWFWLFIDQLFLLFPGSWMIPVGAVVVETVVLFALLLLPWIDRSPGLKPSHRPVAIAVIIVVVGSMFVLALLAASRVYNYEFINNPR